MHAAIATAQIGRRLRIPVRTSAVNASPAVDAQSTYETAFTLQAAQAEAADVDGDGLIDIVTIDTTAPSERALLLLGRGDGTFAAGSTHLLLQAGAAGVQIQVQAGRLAIALAGASAPTRAPADGPTGRSSDR